MASTGILGMFGNKDKNKTATEKAPTSFTNTQSVIPAKANKEMSKSNSTTLIAKDTEIHGDVKFSGNLEVEGKIFGNITANGGAEASVRVLEFGQVEGDIYVPKANLNGEIKGNVHAKTLELAAKARIDGNVHYEALEMTKGAQVNGNLVYAQAVETASAANQKKAENKPADKSAE